MSRWFSLLVAAVGLPSVGLSQSSIPSNDQLFAITNARIEVGNGSVIPKGTLVMQKGIVVAVGADIKPPPGADILDGTGLTVYPGFIDAYTNKLLTLPAIKAQQDDPPSTVNYASAFMREANRTSIRPELRAADYLNLDANMLKGFQTSGFTGAVVAPDAGIIGGYAAFVELGGAPARDSVLEPQLGMTMGIGSRTGGFSFGGGYPGTALGKIALLRQTLMDSKWADQVASSYRQGGTLRPPYDPTLEALQPVLAGRSPAVFEANGEFEIVRALDMAKEFGLKPMIAGGAEAWKDISLLKDVPVLLSIAFGEEPKDPPKPGDDEQPVDPRKTAEEKRLFLEKVHNAVELDKAGIHFALTSRGCRDSNEFMGNLRRAVKEGLSKSVALSALTDGAARLLGLDSRVGTLEVGKIANVAVFTGDFLDEKSKVKLLYIDGRKIDPAKAAIVPAPHFDFGDEN